MISILQKPNADIYLEVKGGATNPGSSFEVRVNVTSMDNFSVRSGSVELTCTEVYWQIVSTGKTTYQQKCNQKLFKEKKSFLGETNFSIGASEGKTLKFDIPEGFPPSVCGKKVNISWQLKASLDVVKKRDISVKQSIKVEPIATVSLLNGHKGGGFGNITTSFSDNGDLSISLSSWSAAGGAVLKGRFETVMKKPLEVNGVRLELEVKEQAGTMSAKKTVEKIVLEEKTSLMSGGYREWPFELKIPDSPPISVKTEKSSVVWQVKGILDKRLSRDMKVSAQIQVV